MRELSESVYFLTRNRRDGIDWLETVGIVGYVLRPKGQWLQVFPGWDVDDQDKKQRALSKTDGLVLHFFYDTDRRWSATFFYDGEKLSNYECAFDSADCSSSGALPEQVAAKLEASPEELEEIFDEEISEGWQERADRAAQLADLLALPNYAFASYRYADMDAEVTGMCDLFVDLRDDDDERKSTEPPAANGAPTEPKQSGDAGAPWQAAYDLASQFLKRLHDEEFIELTLDSRLVRDRLIERLTKTVIENPISSDTQVVAHWLDNLMEAPEIVDVFATDDMLLETFRQAMEVSMTDEEA